MIGFVGAGRMGEPMVKRLVDAGQVVRVLRRAPGADVRPDTTGAVSVSELHDVASGASAVVVCVHSDDQVRQVCIDDGLLAIMERGSVLIVHTTGSPSTMRTLGALGSRYGVGVVDAPVSGGPHDIAAGEITVFVGGDDTAVERARGVLAFYADPITHVGSLGSGQLTKLVNNAVFLSNIEILCAATEFAEQLGLDIATTVACIAQGSGNSTALIGVAAAGGPQSFKSSVAEFLNKDMHVVRQVAQEAGVDLGSIGMLLSRPRADPGPVPAGAP